ncbi:zymogen granule membrane protein 16-like [Stigmatopora argus]
MKLMTVESKQIEETGLLKENMHHQSGMKMLFLVFSLLLVPFANSQTVPELSVPVGWGKEFSFSAPVGSGSGSSFAIQGSERITGIRIWENYNSYITGIQLRYGYMWSEMAGYARGNIQEMLLYENEAIVQVAGKYTHYIQSLVFTTNMSRSLSAGQPSGHSFNMYPHTKKAELRFISGRQQYGITSIGAHWGVLADRKNPESPH